MKVNDQVYAYVWRDPRANNSNSFLIVSDRTQCLVDPGHAAFLPGLFRQMTADGLRPEEITSVILTHGHPDHMEGGLELQKRGARLGISPKEEAFLQEVGPYFAQMFGFRMPELAFDFYLEEGTLELGSVELRVLETPGHSPGSIALFRPDDRMLFTGDLIFAQGVGRTDFPGGDGELLKESIRRCRALQPSAILSGHGEMILDPAEVERNFDLIERMYFPML